MADAFLRGGRLLLLGCLALSAGAWLTVLSGCAAKTAVANASTDTFTDSDEPDSRKRATNRLRLAMLYFSDGKNTIALDEVKQAIAADPGWFESYNMRGLIHMRSGELSLADASFQKALSIRPGSPEVQHNYGVLLCKQNRIPEAVRMFGSAIATPGYTQRSNTWLEQGICQLGNEQLAEAEASFRKSYEVDFNNPAAAFNLASLLVRRGDSRQAQFYVRRLNNGESSNADSLWLGIKVERNLGNTEPMNQLALQLRRRYPQSRQFLAFERGAFDE
jgi:type IV pilus assembly protein PilF